MWKEFKKFIGRGNVLDLAVAVVIGAAFSKIVASLVEGMLMPPIGLILGRVDFSSLFFVLDHAKGIPGSLAEAKSKGIPVIAYGQFLNDVINFLIIAVVVFLLVRQANRFKDKPEVAAPVTSKPEVVVPVTRACPYCLSMVPLQATRCAFCTSELKAA